MVVLGGEGCFLMSEVPLYLATPHPWVRAQRLGGEEFQSRKSILEMVLGTKLTPQVSANLLQGLVTCCLSLAALSISVSVFGLVGQALPPDAAPFGPRTAAGRTGGGAGGARTPACTLGLFKTPLVLDRFKFVPPHRSYNRLVASLKAAGSNHHTRLSERAGGDDSGRRLQGS